MQKPQNHWLISQFPTVVAEDLRTQYRSTICIPGTHQLDPSLLIHSGLTLEAEWRFKLRYLCLGCGNSSNILMSEPNISFMDSLIQNLMRFLNNVAILINCSLWVDRQTLINNGICTKL